MSLETNEYNKDTTERNLYIKKKHHCITKTKELYTGEFHKD